MTLTQTPLDFDTQREVMRAPAQAHSPTSIAAAIAITPHLNAIQARVLQYLESRGAEGSTDNEGIASGVCHINGYRARRVELFRKGMIHKVGERNGSVVWVAHQKEGV